MRKNHKEKLAERLVQVREKINTSIYITVADRPTIDSKISKILIQYSGSKDLNERLYQGYGLTGLVNLNVLAACLRATIHDVDITQKIDYANEEASNNGYGYHHQSPGGLAGAIEGAITAELFGRLHSDPKRIKTWFDNQPPAPYDPFDDTTTPRGGSGELYRVAQ